MNADELVYNNAYERAIVSVQLVFCSMSSGKAFDLAVLADAGNTKFIYVRIYWYSCSKTLATDRSWTKRECDRSG